MLSVRTGHRNVISSLHRINAAGNPQRCLSNSRDNAFKLLRLHSFSDEELSASFRRLKACPTDTHVNLAFGMKKIMEKYACGMDDAQKSEIINFVASRSAPASAIEPKNVDTITFLEYRRHMKSLGESLDPRVYNIGLSFLLAGGSVGMMIPAMPMLVAQLEIPSSQFGLVIGAFALSKLIGNIPSGYLVEKYGRKPMMIAGLGVCGAGICAIGLALIPGFGTPWLIGCRFISGLGVSAFVAGGFMYMADISTALNRTRTIAPVMAGFSGGAALGPAVGGVLLENIGISNTYLAVGSMFVALSAANQVLISETKPEFCSQLSEKSIRTGVEESIVASDKVSADGAKQLALKAKTNVILSTGASIPEHVPKADSSPVAGDANHHIFSGRPNTSTPRGAAAMPPAPSGAQDENESSTLLTSFGEALVSWKDLLRTNADLRNITLLNGAYWFAYSGTQMTLLPLHMVSPLFHLNAYEIGACFAMMSGVAFVASQPSAILADKFGKRLNIILGSGLLTMSMICLPIASTLPELMALCVPMSLGATAMNATPAALVGDLTEKQDSVVEAKIEDRISNRNSDHQQTLSLDDVSNERDGPAAHEVPQTDGGISPKNRAQALSLLRTVGDVGFLFGAASSGVVAQLLSVPAAMQINGAVLAVSALSFAALSRNILPLHADNESDRNGGTATK